NRHNGLHDKNARFEHDILVVTVAAVSPGERLRLALRLIQQSLALVPHRGIYLTADIPCSNFSIVFLIVVTSLIVSATTKGGRDMNAMRALFEWIGASVLFVVLNVTIGAVIILLIRSLTTHFVALYGLQSLLRSALANPNAPSSRRLLRRSSRAKPFAWGT